MGSSTRRGKRSSWRIQLDESTVIEVAPKRSRAGRAGGRLTLILGVLIAAAMLSTLAVAAVYTDQPDYAPGSVVTISGDSASGETYIQGNTVEVAVNKDDNDWTASCTATVTIDGDWSCQITLSADPDIAVGSYTYTATQKDADGNVISVETGTFTDGQDITVNAPASFLWHKTGEVAGGFNVTVSGKYTCTTGSGGNNCTDATSITVTVPGVTGSKVITGLSDPVTDAAWSTSLEFRTSPAAGQFAIPSSSGKFNVTALLDTNQNDKTDTENDHFGVDNAAPTTDQIQCDAAVCGGTYSADVTVKLGQIKDGTPELSGVASTKYCVDTTDTCSPQPSGTGYPGNPGFTVTYSPGTTKYVRYASADNVGNVETTKSQAIVFSAPADGTAPTGSITINSDDPYTNTTAVTLNLAATDAVGVTAYRVANGSDCSTASWVAVTPTTSYSDDVAFTLTSTDGSRTVCVQYRDAVPNTSTTYTDTIVLDRLAPVIVNGGFVSGTAGTNGWYTSDVVNRFTVTDATSGLNAACQTAFPSGTRDVTISSEGTSVKASSGPCTDLAGNTNSGIDSDPYKIDKTGPSAVLSVTVGTAGANGWYTSNVTVHTAGSDTISDPTTCTADQYQTAETAGTDFNGSCTNDAGLTTNATKLTVKLDKTGPSAVLSVTVGTAGANGWYTSNVTVHTAGSDTISDPTTCTADQYQTAETAGTDFNGSCTNDAGLTTNATKLTVKLDKTDPTVAITSPTATTYKPSVYTALCSPPGPAAVGDVCGTSSDATSGVNKVEVRIKRGSAPVEYWTGSAWSTTETWKDATGTATWSFLFAEDITVDPEIYTLTARATDNATNVGTSTAVTFTIAKVATTLLVNPVYDNDGGTTSSFSATLSSSDTACYQIKPVSFYIDLDGNGSFSDSGEALGPFNTNNSGVASSGSITVVLGTIYDIKAVYEGNGDCIGSEDESTLTVTSPGDSANGGGWYQLPTSGHSGNRRVNFGFTVRKVPNTTNTYKGQILVMNTHQWRIKGNLDSGFGIILSGSGFCSSSFGSGPCGAASGTGTLYKWVPATLLVPGYWDSKGTVTYTFGFYDGGSSKKGGAKLDYAGLLTITGYSPGGGEFLPKDPALNVLMGGNVKFVP